MKAQVNYMKIILISAFMCMAEVANAFYDPGLQRWINRDPIAERGGINLFVVAYNDPQSRIDPNGNCPLLPIFIGGFIWGAVMTPDIADAPAPGDPTYGTTIGDRVVCGLACGTINVGVGALGGAGGRITRNAVPNVAPESLSAPLPSPAGPTPGISAPRPTVTGPSGGGGGYLTPGYYNYPVRLTCSL
jgi:hypothetical protein